MKDSQLFFVVSKAYVVAKGYQVMCVGFHTQDIIWSKHFKARYLKVTKSDEVYIEVNKYLVDWLKELDGIAIKRVEYVTQVGKVNLSLNDFAMAVKHRLLVVSERQFSNTIRLPSSQLNGIKDHPDLFTINHERYKYKVSAKNILTLVAKQYRVITNANQVLYDFIAQHNLMMVSSTDLRRFENGNSIIDAYVLMVIGDDQITCGIVNWNFLHQALEITSCQPLYNLI